MGFFFEGIKSSKIDYDDGCVTCKYNKNIELYTVNGQIMFANCISRKLFKQVKMLAFKNLCTTLNFLILMYFLNNLFP